MTRSLLAIGVVALSWVGVSIRSDPDDQLGSLAWVTRTGGAMSFEEKTAYVARSVPDLVVAAAKRPFAEEAAVVDPALFIPPNTPIVQAALEDLRGALDPAFINHSLRTACWTLVLMKQEHPALTSQEIDEAWVAGLLHDVGLARTPPHREFTLGGAAEATRLAERFGWSVAAAARVSEAIVLNPNGSVDRSRYGLLAWAMNVGGFGETFYGPYRVLMNATNVAQLEALYPRGELRSRAQELVDREIHRYPNQRFAVLHDIGFLALTRGD